VFFESLLSPIKSVAKNWQVYSFNTVCQTRLCDEGPNMCFRRLSRCSLPFWFARNQICIFWSNTKDREFTYLSKKFLQKIAKSFSAKHLERSYIKTIHFLTLLFISNFHSACYEFLTDEFKAHSLHSTFILDFYSTIAKVAKWHVWQEIYAPYLIPMTH
jgi:hypothetical protein